MFVTGLAIGCGKQLEDYVKLNPDSAGGGNGSISPDPKATGTITSDSYSQLVTGAFTTTITFSEIVSGLTLSNIVVTNGTASNLSGGPVIYTATITPTTQGAVDIAVTTTGLTSVSGLAIETPLPDRVYYDLVPATFSVDNSSYNNILTAGATSATVKVNVSTAKPYPMVVNYELFGNTTTGTEHNLAGTGTITIPANATSGTKTFSLLASSVASLKTIGVQLTKTHSLFSITGSAASTQHMHEAQVPHYLSVAANGVASHTCFVKSNGDLYCQGTNGNYYLGIGDTDPREFLTLVGTGFKKVAVGSYHSCAIKNNGEMYCWGYNNSYMLGDGTTTTRQTPTLIDGTTVYADLCAGGWRTCGITDTGVLKCWGPSTNGEVGHNSTATAQTPTVIDPGTTYKEISCAAANTCGITTAGVLKCWGEGNAGAVGDGTQFTDRLAPTVIDAGTTYSKVSIGWRHGLAITTAGVLKGWGTPPASNNVLGAGSAGNSYLTPTVLMAGTTFKAVWAEGNSSSGQSCVISTAGELSCTDAATGFTVRDTVNSNYVSVITNGSDSIWALANYGGTNNVLKTNVNLSVNKTPVGLDDTQSVASISETMHKQFCRILTGGELRCTGTTLRSPLPFDQTVAYSKIAEGTDASCAITTTGVLKCWGTNAYGAAGVGSTSPVTTPTVVDSGTTYKEISAGYQHMCGITSADVLKCWGDNTTGQLGDNSTTQRTSPVVIASGTAYAKVRAGLNYSCGITTAGDAMCWGANGNSQLGDNSLTQRNVPTPITLLVAGTKFSEIAVTSIDKGNSFATNRMTTCAIETPSGQLYCWGNNSGGQMGDGTTNNNSYMTPVDVGNTYKAVSIVGLVSPSTTQGYGKFGCGILTNGTMRCWGWGRSYRLGDGTDANHLTPITVDAGTTYKAVTAGATSACGLTTGNKVKCWGENIERHWLSNQLTVVDY